MLCVETPCILYIVLTDYYVFKARRFFKNKETPSWQEHSPNIVKTCCKVSFTALFSVHNLIWIVPRRGKQRQSYEIGSIKIFNLVFYNVLTSVEDSKQNVERRFSYSCRKKVIYWIIETITFTFIFQFISWGLKSS